MSLNKIWLLRIQYGSVNVLTIYLPFCSKITNTKTFYVHSIYWKLMSSQYLYMHYRDYYIFKFNIPYKIFKDHGIFAQVQLMSALSFGNICTRPNRYRHTLHKFLKILNKNCKICRRLITTNYTFKIASCGTKT